MDPNLSAVVVGRGYGSSQRISEKTQRLEVPHRPEHSVPGDLLRLRHAPNAMTRQAFPQRMLRTATDNKLSMEDVYKHPVVVLSRFGTEYLDVCLMTSFKDTPLQQKYDDAQIQRPTFRTPERITIIHLPRRTHDMRLFTSRTAQPSTVPATCQPAQYLERTSRS
ncbi:hypothetical protein LTR95_006915 [Oleoguttula sp. CCFEE 5521]